jgi:metal-dependent hydrolase (beta-lactamase superfamily II)
MKIRITILSDNLVGHESASGEHGFSAFIDADEGNYLFDTGRGPTVMAILSSWLGT